MKRWMAALGVLALGACSMLSAPAPLFAPADQDSAFVLAEGLWVAKGADCDVNPARSRPERDTCLDWARITRAADGAWRIAPIEEGEDVSRIVIVPAAPASGPGRAPLYVGELVDEGGGEIVYAALVAAQSEEGPVKRLHAAGVECHVTHGAWGEIDGIELAREDGKVVKCTALSKPAVQEAARRAAINALPTLQDSEFLFVRP